MRAGANNARTIFQGYIILSKRFWMRGGKNGIRSSNTRSPTQIRDILSSVSHPLFAQDPAKSPTSCSCDEKDVFCFHSGIASAKNRREKRHVVGSNMGEITFTGMVEPYTL